MPDEIAVGENPEQLLIVACHHRGAGPHRGHGLEHAADVGRWPNEGERTARAHDLVHTQEKAAPDHPAGMEFREIFLLKSARLEQHHGKRVAEREHDGRARGRGQIERTGFLLDVDVEEDIAILPQGRLSGAAHRDHANLEPRDRGQDAQEFLGLAAVAEREHNVAIGDHAEIAVERVEGVEHDRGRTGAGESGGDLFADMSRFSDSRGR